MTIADFRKKYYKKVDSLDLELIIAHGIGKTREFVLAHPECIIPATRNSQLATLIKRRMKHEPLAYILGHKEFFGLDFRVSKAVLVPRPETEMLVEEVLRPQSKDATIIDVGTGSGNIIVSLIKNLEAKNKLFALDISAEALKVARQNASDHKVARNINFIKSDLINYFLTHSSLIKSDCIFVANLPYLDIGWKNLLKSSETKGLKFEPQIALYAGTDGLDAYRKLASQLKLLKEKNRNNIIVFCEIGHIQKKEMEKIFFFAAKTEFIKDLSEKWRICKISL